MPLTRLKAHDCLRSSKNHCLHNAFSRLQGSFFNELVPLEKLSRTCVLLIFFRRRAANETRTRDPDLGKVVLYQLSYCRIAFGKSCYRMPLTRHKAHDCLRSSKNNACAFFFEVQPFGCIVAPNSGVFSKSTCSSRKSGCKSTTNFSNMQIYALKCSKNPYFSADLAICALQTVVVYSTVTDFARLRG